MLEGLPFVVVALAVCAGLVSLLLIIRVLGQPTLQFAGDLWGWAAEQGMVGKLIYITAWIVILPAMLAFCVAGGLVLQIVERRRGSQNT